ncbi:OadG family protein [Pseudobutyrivibrio ruminis]|uniref:OadG family protein n=1 Tax=Pseudobutyrivibrio ruminis TaxID=46206 RepID=UPI0004137E41|nr:OadG family protein [Pseudobutyrivibrio ruminis]
MKKNLLLVLCTLVLMFSLTACGSHADEKIGGLPKSNYEEMLKNTMTQLESIDGATAESYITQAESSDDTVSAGLFRNWVECYKVRGEFVDYYDNNAVVGGVNIGPFNIGGTKAFDVSKSGKTITATLVGHYSKRDLKLTVVFNANDMKSGATAINIEPVYSLGETMQKAGLNTVMGILIVFAMLIVMSGIIKSFELIAKVQNKAKAKEEVVVSAPAAVSAPVKNETDDLQLVAVIAAAIAASTGASTDSFVVRSIKKRR